jgi:hypothetical protein
VLAVVFLLALAVVFLAEVLVDLDEGCAGFDFFLLVLAETGFTCAGFICFTCADFAGLFLVDVAFACIDFVFLVSCFAEDFGAWPFTLFVFFADVFFACGFFPEVFLAGFAFLALSLFFLQNAAFESLLWCCWVVCGLFLVFALSSDFAAARALSSARVITRVSAALSTFRIWPPISGHCAAI